MTACLILVTLTGNGAPAQPDPRALFVGGGIGTGIYHGEFNSLDGNFLPTPGFNANLFLQYNLNSTFAVGGGIGYASLPYSISDFARFKYASNFFGPMDATTYPGTPIGITESNGITFTSFNLFGKLHLADLFPGKWTPYGTFGFGLLTFDAKTDDGEPLPTNLTGPYGQSPFYFPLGAGVEYPLSSLLKAYGEIVYHRTFSDYLDGYAHYLDYETGSIATGPGSRETQADHFTLFRVGVMLKLYQYEPDPEEEESEPLASRDRTPLGDDVPPYVGDDSTEIVETPDEEYLPGPNPPTADDRDGDGLADVDERTRLGTSPDLVDSDGDGLSDYEETEQFITNPNAADTDGDLLADAAEVRRLGTSPRAADTDEDYLTDGTEVMITGSDPLRPDTDGDGVIDGRDDCPLIPGPPENNGCPEGRTSAPIASVEDTLSFADAVPADRLPDMIEPIEPGHRMEFGDIFFRSGSDDLDFSRPETLRNLADLLEYLQECDDIGVLLEGHTSSEGNPDWNRKLSKQRADRVRDWLIANGVESEKILGTIGYGSRILKLPEPIPGTVSSEAVERIRAQNRRITALVRKPCSMGRTAVGAR